MIDTKRPFTFNTQIADRLPVIRRNQSVPTFGNCSLDDNPGNGDLNNGLGMGAQLNGYLNWDAETIVDRPGEWQMTVWLDGSAPLPECAVDLTPRRCQQFKPRPGDTFCWVSTAADGRKTIQSGTVVADSWGLVTLKELAVDKGKNRIRISK
jgi:hypothetical protein